MDLVILRSFRDPIDAELARARLEAAGIQALILDQYLPAIHWLYSNAIGGVKVKVDRSDLAAARELLGEDRASDLSEIRENAIAASTGDQCPTCASSDVRTSRLQRYSAAFSLATGLPLVAWRRRWVCASCGHSWLQEHSLEADDPDETLRAEELVREDNSYPLFRPFVLALLGLAILYYVQDRIRHP